MRHRYPFPFLIAKTVPGVTCEVGGFPWAQKASHPSPHLLYSLQWQQHAKAYPLLGIRYDAPAAVLFVHTAHQAHTCAVSRRRTHRRRKEVGMRSPTPLRHLVSLVGLTINLNIILCDVRWSLTALWVPINDPMSISTRCHLMSLDVT